MQGSMFLYGSRLPTWIAAVTMVMMFATIFVPALIFAFGPKAIVDRFPATSRPRSLAIVAGYAVWVALGILTRLLEHAVPESALQGIEFLAFLAVGWFWFAPMFGYGRLGRMLAEAAKQEERESWRN